jgi:Tol biopolymer transport system component
LNNVALRIAATTFSYAIFVLSVGATPITPTANEQAAREALGQRLAGSRLLWVNQDKIFYSTLNDFTPQQVSPDGATEGNPRWSPDGTKILFVREPEGVFVMDADFSNSALVIPGADTASWTRSGDSITAVASDGYRVLRYDLGSGDTTTIYDSREAPYNGQKVSQAAELRNGGRFLLTFRLTPEHVTEIVDLQNETYISNSQMERGDCSPAWSPDGSYILTTARTSNRPVLKTVFHSGSASVDDSAHFIGVADTCECNSFYIHGQRVSNDGQWVAFGAKIFDGPKQDGIREIWIWKIDEPETNAVRVTFDTAEDQSPSLFILENPDQDGADADDAGHDAGHDAGQDAGHDAGQDAGQDAGDDNQATDQAADAADQAPATESDDPQVEQIVGRCGCFSTEPDIGIFLVLVAVFYALCRNRRVRSNES